VNHSFGQKTFHKIITPFLQAAFQQPDDGGTCNVFLEELGIHEIFEGREPSAELVAAEAFQQLSCAPLLGRQSAQDSLTRLITSPKYIEQGAAKIIDALIESWRIDLSEALRQHFPRASMSESGKHFTIKLPGGMPTDLDASISALREGEYERTDWTLRLIAVRSSDYRQELKQAKDQLRRIYRERSGTSVEIVDATGKNRRSFKVRPISLTAERKFLAELKAKTAARLAELTELCLPRSISAVVGKQLLHPALHAEAMCELDQLQVPAETLGLSETALQDGTPEEYATIAKEQAAALMKYAAFEAGLFLERASQRPQRCLPLGAVSPDESTQEVQVAQIAEGVRSEVLRVVRDPRVADRLVVALLRDANNHILESQDPFGAPWLFSYNIDGPDAHDGRARMVVLAICPLLRERPWYSGESDDNYYQPSATLTSAVAILADRLDRPLLDDGSVFMRWLRSFKRLLDQVPADEAAAEEAVQPEDSAGGITCLDGSKDSSWRYYHLTHSEVEEAFNSPLSGETDSATKHHCSFFDLASSRFSDVWNLLPADNFFSAKISPIEQLPPLTAAIQTFATLERYYELLQGLSEAQQERVRNWLVCYQQWSDASTVGLLLALPTWRLAADFCPSDRAVLFPEVDPDDESDEGAYGWSIDTARSNQKLFGRYFSDDQHHVLQSALKPEAVESVKKLLSTGHIYFDSLSAECLICLNDRPHAQIKEVLIGMIEEALALNTRRLAQDWFDLREQNEKSSALALRSSAGRVWAAILGRLAPPAE
jgi:hypothetical protein